MPQAPEGAAPAPTAAAAASKAAAPQPAAAEQKKAAPAASAAAAAADNKDTAAAAAARLDPHFAYKALNNKDTLHTKHYILRALCLDSVSLCSAL